MNYYILITLMLGWGEIVSYFSSPKDGPTLGFETLRIILNLTQVFFYYK